VTHLGAASAVSLGRNPNGDRTAVLTFKAGRARRLSLHRGRLEEMDRVEGPPPAPSPRKRRSRRKTAGAKTATEHLNSAAASIDARRLP